MSGTEYASKTASKDYTVVKKYTATIATGITGGAVSFNADTQQNTLNNLTAGYTVNVFVTENTDWELHFEKVPGERNYTGRVVEKDRYAQGIH